MFSDPVLQGTKKARLFLAAATVVLFASYGGMVIPKPAGLLVMLGGIASTIGLFVVAVVVLRKELKYRLQLVESWQTQAKQLHVPLAKAARLLLSDEWSVNTLEEVLEQLYLAHDYLETQMAWGERQLTTEILRRLNVDSSQQEREELSRKLEEYEQAKRERLWDYMESFHRKVIRGLF